LIGECGIGKTHLRIVLAAAAEHSYRVDACSFQSLSIAGRSRRRRPLSTTVARYSGADLLPLELGDLLDRRRAELLLFGWSPSGRRRRASALPAALLRLAKTFTDPRLCAAMVDRLTYPTGTTRYRPAHE
jgi:hypothetical protein